MDDVRWLRVGSIGGDPSRSSHIVERDATVTRCGMDFGDVFGIGMVWPPTKKRCAKCKRARRRASDA